MLRLDPVRVEMPATAEEAVALLHQHQEGARLVAGGTDIVPNLKHNLLEPVVLVHLGRAQNALSGVQDDGDHLVIGAMTTLHDISVNPLVTAHCPALADAAHHVAGPQLRRMGTIGGNLCLDTRCLYYNQTYFWREALGFCLKKDGTQCHVVAGGKKCVAAASNDGATALLALGADLTILGPDGSRTLPLADFYVADGVRNTVLARDEMVTSVRVKKAGPHRREGFAKLRHREAIDYPMLSVAVALHVDDNDIVEAATLIVNALAARPKSVRLDFCVGKKWDAALDEDIAARAHKQCTPMTNICDDPGWRKDMVPVYVHKALRKARA